MLINPKITALLDEKYRDYINSKYSNDNNLVVECVLRATAPISEGFFIRELGIFDEDEELIVVVKIPEQYRPVASEGVGTESIFSIVLKLENTNNIEIKLSEQIFVTQLSLDREVVNREEADKNTIKQ